MVSKLGKEKTVNVNPHFRTRYGAVDAKNLTALYLEIQAWVQPMNDEVDFKKSVNYLRKVAFNTVYNNLNTALFKEKYIVDLDLRTSGMSVDRHSFMCLEITLFTKSSLKFKSEDISQNVTELLHSITKELEKNKFSFKPKKN